MGFIHGLAVVLVIFEGFKIQCEGAGDATSSKQIHDESTNDIKKDQSFLPNDLIEVIVSKTDFETIQVTIRSQIVRATNVVMSGILKDRTIVFLPDLNGGIYEDYQLGDSFLTFGNYQSLISFFDKFGDYVKKIEIDLEEGFVQRKEIVHDIIKRYAKNLEALRIQTFGDEDFWEEMSNGDTDIIFPEVKKFQIFGTSSRNDLKLNFIFPKLESLKLSGTVADVNCLTNVKGLKELTLRTSSIQEDQLEDVFANNKNLTMVTLSAPNRTETMQSIAKYLTKLETLNVEFPGEDFLVRINDNAVYKLPSVTHFNIIFSEMDEVFGNGNHSFDMSNLKKLTLNGDRTDDRIIDFIKHFKELEILELLVHEYNAEECIDELKNIKELTAIYYEDGFVSLKNIFEHFDKESKLQTLKLLHYDESLFQTCEAEMKEINIHLNNSTKPIWTLSHGKQIETDHKYLMFRREPCTYNFCNK